jgi:hypothetical protein
METNRNASNSTGVTDGRLSIREKKRTELSRAALESEVKGKIISKNFNYDGYSSQSELQYTLV